MQQMPDNTDGSEKASGRDPTGSTLQPGHSQTKTAAREFLRAVGSDLAGLAHQFQQYRRRRLTKRAQTADATSSQHAPSSKTGKRSLALATAIVLRRYTIAIVALATVGALALSGAMLWAIHDMPLERPSDAARPALLLEAADGEALGRVGSLKFADAARADFPDRLLQAVLSIEDRRFYNHFGIDPVGIVRALHRNAQAGEIVEGGSTITQQLVKMQIVGNERTMVRKLREALTAIWLDRRLGKEEILTRYLNNVYLGAGAYGMPAAARLYFDKRLDQLNLAEAAMLAGLIKAPSQYNPLRDLEGARDRAAIVIDAMAETGTIDSQTAAEAKAHPATLHPTTEAAQAGSWFADWVGREAVSVTGSFTRSVRVRTTLDPRLQRLAEDVVNSALATEGKRVGASQAALVALRPDGAVLAMVGGRDYRESQFNRAVEANRHPGSAFKLFVYLAALRKGLGPNDTIDAGPVEINGWEPENFGGREYGRVTLADAFARSINTAAVRLAMDVGLDEVIRAARDLGIDARLPKNPSMALGAVEISLLDLTGAFASVRAGRTHVEPWGIAAFGPEGQPRLQTMGPPMVGSQQSLGRYQQPMIDLLRGVVEHGTGKAAALNGFAAGKTGTSQNHRDAWFIGFNESLVVGVWVGNDDSSSMKGVVGGALPAAIWKRFMTQAPALIAQSDARAASVTADRAAPASSQSQASQSQASQPQASPGSRASLTPQASSNQPPPAQCDYQACASRRSFRASDCTYQPYSGPRRSCEMPTRATTAPEQASRPASPGEAPQSPTEARAQAPQCNMDVCSRFYSSFNPSDCTYQPYGGGSRRTCER
jgi:penicillin-binding protein 1A